MSLRIRIASLDDPAERKKQQLGGLQIVCETLDPQQRPHASVQLFEVDRLVEKVVGARLQARQPIATISDRADQNDRRQASVAVGFELGADIQP